MYAPTVQPRGVRRRSKTRRIRRSTHTYLTNPTGPDHSLHAQTPGNDHQQIIGQSSSTMVPSEPSLIESLLASAAEFQPRSADQDDYSSWDLSLPAMMVLDMLDKRDLLALRATSRRMKTWVEIDPSRYHVRVFKNLYFHGTVNNRQHLKQALDTLKEIAPYCDQLRVVLYDKTIVFETPYLSLEGTKDTFWIHAFSMLSPTIQTLSISAPGRNDWDWLAYGSIERQVVAIRIAMESKFSKGLEALHLDPINTGALLNLRWHGACIISSSSQAEPFWSNLMWLRIKLFNPLDHLRHTNRVDFLKTLHDFLGSFRRSLRGLDFEWIGPQGPSPLMLDLVTDVEGLFHAEPFQWNGLAKVRLINTDAVEQTEFEVVRATRARHLKMLVILDDAPTRTLSSASQESSLAPLSPVSSDGGFDIMDDTDELMFRLEL